MKLDNSYKRMKKALHVLNNVTVTITTKELAKNGPFTNANKPKTIVENYPAKVIKGGLSAPEQAESLPDTYDATLNIDNLVEVPAGCIIVATDFNGRVTTYKRASRGYAGYHSHQEIAMILDEKA